MALQKMVDVAFQHKFSITKTAEGKLFSSGVDIPIPFRDAVAFNIYEKNSYPLTPSRSEYQNESVSNKEVHFVEEAKDGLSLSEQAFPGPVMKLLRWSFGDIIHACADSKNLLLAEQLMLQVSEFVI